MEGKRGRERGREWKKEKRGMKKSKVNLSVKKRLDGVERGREEKGGVEKEDKGRAEWGR